MSDDDLKSSYLRSEIDSSDDEENAREAAADGGDEQNVDRIPVTDLTQEQLVERYEGLVHSVAFDIHDNKSAGVPFEDVKAYGYEGLLEAHKRFDPDKGVSFSSFAYYRVRGAILDAFRSQEWSTRDQHFELKDDIALNDHMASHNEATSHLPRSKTFKDSIKHIDQMVGDSVTILLMRHFDLQDLETTEEAQQFDSADRRQKLKLIRAALDGLSDNEREVVTRYHLDDDTLTDIAEDLDLSKGWVSRVNARAIDKIRKHILRATGERPEPLH